MNFYVTPDAVLRRAAKKRKAVEDAQRRAARLVLTKRDERRLLRMLDEDEGVK